MSRSETERLAHERCVNKLLHNKTLSFDLVLKPRLNVGL